MLGSFYKVTSITTGRTVELQCLDTGGFRRYGRLLDIGKEAFSRIDDTAKGVIEVTVEEIANG